MISESKFREIYRGHQESGLSVKAFCVNEGIAESTTYYWSKKMRKKDSTKQDFIPLVVIPSDSTSLWTDLLLVNVFYDQGTFGIFALELSPMPGTQKRPGEKLVLLTGSSFILFRF